MSQFDGDGGHNYINKLLATYMDNKRVSLRNDLEGEKSRFYMKHG
jgi:hypothetical protein